MKTKITLTFGVLLVLALAVNANAQLVAGTAEDRAYTAITSENNPDAKLALLIAFEKNFPQSRVLADICLMAIDIFKNKKDVLKVAEWGEKAIKADPENVNALMETSRNYAMERKSLEKAVSYAQRAVDSVAKKKNEPPPMGYSDDQWKQYLESLDNSAKMLLTYAKGIRP